MSVGGIQTNYVLNSTSRFDFQTQLAAKQNSIYKNTGLASVVIDFYAYPNLAGPATLNGTWQVFLSANSSGYHPTIFNMRFREFPLGSGTATYDSGQINPIVTSSIGAYLDVPVYSYNLTTPTALGHTFAQGSTIDLSVTVNDGAAADSRIWYDSPSFPSKVILPVVNPGEPAKIWTADTTGAARSTFPTQSQTVMISANVTDPFGGYDVNATAVGTKGALVTLSLTGPSGSTLVNGQRMTQLTGGVAVLNNLFQSNVSISGTAGNYIATVSSTDNSGNLEQLSYTFAVGTVPSPGSPTTLPLILIGIIIGLLALVVALFALTQGRKKKAVEAQPATSN